MYRNIVANIVGRCWSILSNFLFVPLYIQFLGIESYSIISLTLVIAGLMAVLDVGLTASLSREFALSTNSCKSKLDIFLTLETCYFIIAFIIIVMTLSTSNIVVNKWLKLDGLDPSEVASYIRIMGIGIAFQFLGQFYMGGLLGLEKQVVANVYQISWSAVRNGLIIIPIVFIPSLKLFFIWQTVATLIYAILLRYTILGILSSTQYCFLKLPKIDWKIVHKIGRFASGMLLISLVAGLNSQMDKLAISKILPITILGFYTLAVSLTNSLNVLISPISIAFLPRLTSLFSENKREEAFRLYKKVFLLVAIIVFSVGSNLVIYDEEILFVWTGNWEIAKSACLFIPYLVMGMSSLALSTIPYNIAIANAYTRLNNILGILSLTVTLPGYWLLTNIYGAVGTALVWGGIQTLIFPIYLSLIHRKYFSTVKNVIFFTKMILFPFLISYCVTEIFSLISLNLTNRWLMLLWIGVSVLLSLFFNFIFLVREKRIFFQLIYRNK